MLQDVCLTQPGTLASPPNFCPLQTKPVFNQAFHQLKGSRRAELWGPRAIRMVPAVVREMGAYMRVVPGLLASPAYLEHLGWNQCVLPQWFQSWCPSSDMGQRCPCLHSDSDHCSGRAWPCHGDSALQSPQSPAAQRRAGSAGCGARLSLLSPLLLGKLPWLTIHEPLWHLHIHTGNRAPCEPLSPPSKICHDRSEEGLRLTC